MSTNDRPADRRAGRLDSWKEIASYLGRSERTVRRWEEKEGLPVHRLHHEKRGSVYAQPEELDAWWESKRKCLSEPPASPIKPVPPASALRQRWPTWVAGIFVITVSIAVAGILILRNPGLPPNPILAVVPFTIEGGDSSDAFLGSGIAEDVAEHLSHSRDLQVRPFAASLRLYKAASDPMAVGRELQSDVLLTGTVRAAGVQKQVSVALLDLAANRQMWAQSFPLDNSLLADAPRRIAVAVHDRLRQSPLPESRPLSANDDAFRAYLRAREFARIVGRATVADAIKLLEEAIRLDPEFSTAYATLAIANIAQAWYSEVPATRTFARARELAQKSLALGQAGPHARMVLSALLHWSDFRHQDAANAYRKVIQQHPHFAGNLSWFADFLIDMRQFEEGLRMGRRAAEADPGWFEPLVVQGVAFLFSGRIDQAIERFETARKAQPNYGVSRMFLGRALLMKGRPAEAVAELRHANDLLGEIPSSVAELGYALAKSGQRTEAENLLAQVMQRRSAGFYPAFVAAYIHLGFGNHAQALDWLERAVDERMTGYYMPYADTIWDPLRNHPRFQKSIRRLGY